MVHRAALNVLLDRVQVHRSERGAHGPSGLKGAHGPSHRSQCAS